MAPGVRLGLWRMDESPAEMLQQYPHLSSLPMPYKSDARQKEFLCVRALLCEMSGSTALTIDHTDSGRPVVKGWHVSISHTKGYAVLMMSRKAHLGVDIEYRSDRITKIAKKFVRDDEDATTLEELLTLWCAKETLYKLYSDDNLQFFEMKKLPTNDNDYLMENMKRGATVTLHHEHTADYVLTWAVG